MPDEICLTGHDLAPGDLAAIARGARVRLADAGLDRMARAAAVIAGAIERQQAMYGVTTGLGPRVVNRLTPDEQVEMALNTIRGRAHSAGRPLAVPLVRAGMAVRANTLLIGAAGAAPGLAELVAGCVNAGLTPVIGETGSIGAADLMWGGSMALGLIGEGEMDTPDGRQPAAAALAAAGLRPLVPGGRDGLAAVSHSSFVAAMAAIGLVRAKNSLETAQSAAATTLEGFRANLTPLRAEALKLRPQAGQIRAAAGLARRLEGSALHQPEQARRLQDPLSLRNLPQIHGLAFAALDMLEAAVGDEINGASDNPVVLLDTGEVVSSGGYLTSYLAVVLNMAAQAFVHLAAAQVARMSRLVTTRFTDLPVGLVQGGTSSAGMAPAMKTAEALFSEIVHLAQPAPVYPSGAADGVEDVVAHSAVPARTLHEIVDRLERLNAMELIVATQAVEMRRLDRVAPAIARIIAAVRMAAPPMTRDAPLSPAIEALAARVALGAFADR